MRRLFRREPQRVNPHHADLPFECEICRTPSKETHLDASIIDELSHFDKLLQQPPTALSAHDRLNVPFSLAAGGALTYSVHAAIDEPFGTAQMSSGRVTYRAALAFLYSIINLSPSNKIIHVPVVAIQLHQRYSMPSYVSLEKWRKDFSSAAAVALMRGHLTKISKGRYQVLRSGG
jgi:hypothetical protein